MELGLTEEQAEKVLAKYVNMIPKHRFDEVNEEKKELKNQLYERDAQLKELKAKTSGNEELTAKITELEKLNKTTKEEYEAKMTALRKEQGSLF